MSIRVAYIDVIRKRPDEFQKRLRNFIEKTSQNKMLKGSAGNREMHFIEYADVLEGL